MDAVIEKNVVRQTRDAVPRHRLVDGRALYDRLQHRGVSKKLRVARKTGLAGRHAREGRSLDGGVTKTAIDPQLTRVVAMAE